MLFNLYLKPMNSLKSEQVRLKAKRTFLSKGTCSRTFFYILDREFGHPLEEEEKAIDPMAGGILQQGYQCGMLWGASMAVGAEAFRRNRHPGRATGLAILATRQLMDSFVQRTDSIECEDITRCDFTEKKGLIKFLLSGRFVGCFRLAGRWAPEALRAAGEGLAREQEEFPEESLSCASEVVRKMGGSQEEMMMVAGFAGGLGLSGSGCGALAAAIWKNALIQNRQETGKSASFDVHNDPTLLAFYEETGYDMECHTICGQRFNTLEAHTEFIGNGGCSKLIDALADTRIS
jgi:hypothetical protein